jgi:flagellar protein FlbD
MVNLTRLNHSQFILNSDLIEHIQVTPDTLITLTNGHNYLVLERPEEILGQILSFRRACAVPLCDAAEPVCG